ncbi:hypothetical protein VQ056_18210 [Paenibacillus sp. JTLBN-2024]
MTMPTIFAARCTASGFVTAGRPNTSATWSGERKDHFPTGARVIQLKAGERDFATWIRQNDGTVVYEQPEHQPEGKEVKSS